MSEKLNELKKATMASYLAKAGSRVRSGTKIGLDFEGEKYKHMAVANKHHPNMVTPGFEKDPEKLKSATDKMNAAADLEKTFKRDAANRIKGIARAGRLLAKEDTINERNTESHPDLWNTHQLLHKSGKALKKGDVVKGFRGNYKVHGFELPHHSGSTGRVYVHSVNAKGRRLPGSGYGMDGNEPQSFFPSVIDAKIVKKAVKEEVEQINELQKDVRQALIAKYGDEGKVHFSKDGTKASHITRGLTDDGGDYYKIKTHAIKDGQLGPRIKKSRGKEYTAEEIEAINEVSRSTIAKVAQARFNQAQKALKDKNYHEYVTKMKKAIKAGDATTPKTGWSHEEETQLPEAEPIVEVSAQEKYRQIRESKMRNRKGK